VHISVCFMNSIFFNVHLIQKMIGIYYWSGVQCVVWNQPVPNAHQKRLPKCWQHNRQMQNQLIGDKEMSGKEDVLLCEWFKGWTSEVPQIINKRSTNDRLFGWQRIKRQHISCSKTGNTGASPGTSARGIVNKNKARNSKKWIHTFKDKETRKEETRWTNYWDDVEIGRVGE